MLYEGSNKKAQTDWGAFLDAYALPSTTQPALRNLDGALAVAAQMALAVARLAELKIVHHDIKPANTIVGKDGVRVFDWGLACLYGSDNDVKNAVPGTNFLSTTNGGCSLGCKVGSMSNGGSRGFMSPAKLQFFTPCAESTCTAAELTSVDLFAVGASLLQLLAANVRINGPGLLDKKEACNLPVLPKDTEKRAKEMEKTYFVGLLSSYFSLDGVSGINWESDAAAITASRRRIYSVLALASEGAAASSVLGGNPPLSYFRPGPAKTGLYAPYCFTARRSGPDGLATAKSNERAALRLTLVKASNKPPFPAPARWTSGADDESHLLNLPAASTALAPLLDLLRKLLAYHVHDGFASALDAVREIDRVRKLLATEANAPATFTTKLDCLAATPPQAQVPREQEPAQPRTPLSAADCGSFAMLAQEQMRQRDQGLTQNEADAQRPNEFDIAMAYLECTDKRGPPLPLALLQQQAFAAIVHRHACLNIPQKPWYGKAAPSSIPLATKQILKNKLVTVPLTLEKLPFALQREATGVWQKRAFGLKCDVVLKEGMGAWVHWTGGNPGMGYVVQAFDTSDNAPPERRCNKRYLLRPAGFSCKALDLKYATPRSPDKGDSLNRPRHGLLKLYASNARQLLKDALKGAVQSFTGDKCGPGSMAAAFRHLLEAAAKRTQPKGWRESWAAASRKAQDAALQLLLTQKKWRPEEENYFGSIDVKIK